MSHEYAVWWVNEDHGMSRFSVSHVNGHAPNKMKSQFLMA